MIFSKPLIFFDLETTGVNVATDKIVQIAVTKIHIDGSRESKEMIINPGIPIPKEASEVHGITDEMVQGKPTFLQISKSLKEFFEGCDVGGYNSNVFDFPMLMQEFHRCKIEFPDWELNFIDSLVIERIVNSHKLENTFERYTGEKLEDAHNALADTNATERVFFHQLNRLQEIFIKEGREMTVEQIDAFCQNDKKRFDYAGKCYVQEDKIYWGFGKNQGKEVLSDRGYLNWVLNADFPIETKNKLKSLLKPKQ